MIYCSFAVIVRKLWVLQIEKESYFKELAFSNRIRPVITPAPRGQIFDRNGKILVDNRPRFDLVATLEDVTSLENASKILSQIFNTSSSEILNKLEDKSSHLPYEPSVIYTDLSTKDMIKVSEKFYILPGVDLRILPTRSYIYGKTACHLLGYTGKINEKELKKHPAYHQNDEIGKTGIEEAYESILRGIPGGRQIQINSLGHLDKIIGEKKPVKGNDIHLTLDLAIQQTIETAFQNRTGAAVVMEVKTGNILAMLSLPGYNPNVFASGNSRKISKYFIDSTFPLLNRTISSEYAPGSTFKPIVALAAIKEKFATDTTSIFCNGTFKLGNTSFKCWRKWGHGETGINQSIEQSCNVFYYTMGKEMGPLPIYQMSTLFHFGKKTGIKILGEKKGLVPSPDWKKRYFKNKSAQKWHLGDTINFSIGQGYLLTTPIQLVCYTAAIANHGILPFPNLLKKIVSPTGMIIPLPKHIKPKKLNITASDIEKVRLGMHNVVHAKYGTGRKAKIKGYTAAGKTGTSQVMTNKGEIKNAWFICFAPYENPEIALTILVENSNSGGQDAAPIAKQVLSTYFNVKLTKDSKDIKSITTNMNTESIVNHEIAIINQTQENVPAEKVKKETVEVTGNLKEANEKKENKKQKNENLNDIPPDISRR